MLTIEYRVNGQLIGYTNIHNIGWLPDGERCRYEYCHGTDSMTCHMKGSDIIHQRNKGFERLVVKVLEQVVKRMKENEKEEELK